MTFNQINNIAVEIVKIFIDQKKISGQKLAFYMKFSVVVNTHKRREEDSVNMNNRVTYSLLNNFYKLIRAL